MSAMLRVIVGSASLMALEMLSAVPATELSIATLCPVTVTVSVTDASCSLKSAARCSPRATSTACCFSSLKPLSAAEISYGPTRTLRMSNRPWASVTAS